jgi:uroporphyrinogen-III synthase
MKALLKEAVPPPVRPWSRDLEVIHDIGSRIALAEPLHAVLARAVAIVADLVPCDSCFIYAFEEADLVLRASRTAHPDDVDRLKLRVGPGGTGWVIEHREPVAVGAGASGDRRFQIFSELADDAFEAFLSVPILSRGRVVGVINLRHQEPYQHSTHEVQTVATVGFLVGAEIERARLEGENLQLVERLEERKVIDRAKGILQRDLGISEEEAYVAIQRQARQRRRSKKEIAEAIIIGDELRSVRDGR